MNTPPKCEDLYLKIAELERRESDLMEKIARAGRVSFSFFEERDALQQRLTIAEKRAGVLDSAAREMLRVAGIANQGSNAYSRAIINLHAALKPAAEPENICEGCGSKGWTANCAQCVPY